MKVVSKRPETKEEQMRRFKADKVLARMNSEIAQTNQQEAGPWLNRQELKADKDAYIKDVYPDCMF